MAKRKKCARCGKPPAFPSQRFCDEHRREHGGMLLGQLEAIQRAAGDQPATGQRGATS